MTAAPRLAPDVATFDALAISPHDFGAYQWWYFDALSDDGRFGLTAIYFVGGVFSALYADRTLAGARASPFDHPMVNLALYDRGRRVAWVFTEHPRDALETDDRGAVYLRVGRSHLARRQDGSYELRVVERDFPAARDLDVTIRFHPLEPGVAPPDFRLSSNGRHRWGSPAPRCRVELHAPALGLEWKGHGYHDVNCGTEPLHDGFRAWGWGRAHEGDTTRIYYDAEERDGTLRAMVLEAQDGRLTSTDTRSLSIERRRTPWLLSLPRDVTAGAVHVTRERILESSPFYARWVGRFASTRESTTGICEHVDLDRFRSPLVRWMLRWRTYRVDRNGRLLPRTVTAASLFPDDATPS